MQVHAAGPGSEPAAGTRLEETVMMTARLLTVENARWLVDELDLLVQTANEHDVNLDALENARRLLTSLEDAPVGEHLLQDLLRRLGAWSEVMFGDAHHAGPGSIKATMLEGIRDLRALLAAGTPP